jgi:hypothetical protein
LVVDIVVCSVGSKVRLQVRVLVWSLSFSLLLFSREISGHF